MDKGEELARLEAAVYSRGGSAESAVDFVDPVTGETLRATPSELRLRALRAELAGRAVSGVGNPDDRFARFPPGESARSESLAMPALPVGRGRLSRRRRFVLPLVAAGAFAAGIVTVVMVTSFLAPIAAPGTPIASETAGLLVFDFPAQYPDTPVPDLGERFVPDSLRNVSGTSTIKDGFGVFLGREAGTELYCLIVDSDALAAACATADQVAQRGLRLQASVTVRSRFAYNVSDGVTEMTAELSSRGEFSMSFPPPGEEAVAEPLPTSLAPPATTGTILGTATNGPDAGGDFQGSFDAHGEGLIIALDCVGEGTVTVDLSDGSSMQFECNFIGVESLQNTVGIAYESVGVTVFTTGDVVWGMTIASTPLAEPAQG